MRKLLLALASVSALALPSVLHAQQATITAGATTLLIPSSNDFRTQLQGQGLAYFTQGPGSNITLSAPATLSFTYMGSESGFRDNFTATSLGGPISYQENSSGVENFWPAGIFFGSGTFNGGSLAGLLNFASLDAGALAAGLGSNGFGIFLPPAASALGGAQNPYTTNVFYLGYDDQATNPDDNHDDILIRVNVSPVPEPVTWAMMLVGFGAIGLVMRRSRKVRPLQIV